MFLHIILFIFRQRCIDIRKKSLYLLTQNTIHFHLFQANTAKKMKYTLLIVQSCVIFLAVTSNDSPHKDFYVSPGKYILKSQENLLFVCAKNKKIKLPHTEQKRRKKKKSSIQKRRRRKQCYKNKRKWKMCPMLVFFCFSSFPSLVFQKERRKDRKRTSRHTQQHQH